MLFDIGEYVVSDKRREIETARGSVLVDQDRGLNVTQVVDFHDNSWKFLMLFGSSGGQPWTTAAPPAKRREGLRDSRRCGVSIAKRRSWHGAIAPSQT
jgi:hypothetical protein